MGPYFVGFRGILNERPIPGDHSLGSLQEVRYQRGTLHKPYMYTWYITINYSSIDPI